MNDLVPAVAFPPGDYIREALDERGWTQDEFAEIIGRSPRFVGELISGEKAITPRAAKELAAALGTSAILWLNLEAAYRLHHSQDPVSTRITRQARLRERFAVREMVKRGWIEASRDPDVLEGQVCRFFDIKSIDETPQLAHAAKKTDYPASLTGAQQAWLFRVKQIAAAMPVRAYSEGALRAAIPKLRALLLSPDEIRHVPRVLADCGVRFVIVEHVATSKIDGVCFWLKRKSLSPVIGLSLRLGRIDNFWFVLRHEIEHVLNKHGREEAIVDQDVDHALAAKDIPAEERIANAAGADFCVPATAMNDFLLRHDPIFREENVLNFATRMQVHPGLVVGQLQRKTGRYDLHRQHLINVRHIIAPVAMTDGFGQVLPLKA
jgi:HTH-type transcriptional regulator/antitoxin HigA